MNVLDLLIGKKIEYITDAKVPVILEITKAEEIPHSEDLEPATQANDWWPKTRDWTTIKVTFTTGFKKEYNNLKEIKLIND